MHAKLCWGITLWHWLLCTSCLSAADGLLSISYCCACVDNRLWSCWEKQEGNCDTKWISKSLSQCGRGTVVKWNVTELAGLGLVTRYFWNTKQGANKHWNRDAGRWAVTFALTRLAWDPGFQPHTDAVVLYCLYTDMLLFQPCLSSGVAWASNLHVKNYWSFCRWNLGQNCEVWMHL